MENNTQVFPIQKRIALIAHDNKKTEMVQWCKENVEILRTHFLCGTGTTAGLIAKHTSLPVFAYKSGPLGGDQQIGAKITEGAIDMMFFFFDALEAQPHDPDVKALLRIAALYNIPVATNSATADFIISSPLMNQVYHRRDSDGKYHTQTFAE
jgi:methylglyoxal synthase